MTTLHLVIAIIVTAAVFALVFFHVGSAYRKKTAEAEIGSAETEAKRLINDAIKASENKKREMLVEAKEETHQIKLELEKELKERRSELQKQERRIMQKEESLDKKMDSLDRKNEVLSKKIHEAETGKEEIDNIKKQQMAELERISG
ncbi:MAG: DUF3552 domain-containing protein, partial [Clostridia bacterium]|nr:DUF3552 domain-containing protein [Clostridia bacterium]